MLGYVCCAFCQRAGAGTCTGTGKEGMVKYTPDFRFNDGIYLNFDQVKLNRPIPKANCLLLLITTTGNSSKKFWHLKRSIFMMIWESGRKLTEILSGVIHAMELFMFRYRKISTGLLLWEASVILLLI